VKVPISGIPHHLEATIKGFQNLGSEYLNVIFGWKPFIKDLRALYKAMKDLDRQVNQLAAQNGQRIRRRAVLSDTNDTVGERVIYNAPLAQMYGSVNPYAKGITDWSRATTNKERIWYSACYRYYIPQPLSWQWRAKAKAILLGGYPTPANLYAAMPWSWMVDWFTSIGSILKALGPVAVDNLVQLYGFTMRQTTKKVVCTVSTSYPSFDNVLINQFGEFGYRYTGASLNTSSVYTDIVKTRSGGFNPFGPDKIAAGFSPYQLSVLSALGLTRLG
jgi:hypothetical protein